MLEQTIGPLIQIMPAVLIGTLAVGGMWYRVNSLAKRVHTNEVEFRDHLKESIDVQKNLTEIKTELKYLRDDIRELKGHSRNERF